MIRWTNVHPIWGSTDLMCERLVSPITEYRRSRADKFSLG